MQTDEKSNGLLLLVEVGVSYSQRCFALELLRLASQGMNLSAT